MCNGQYINLAVALLTSVLFPGEFQLKPGQHFSSLLPFHKWLLSAA